MTADRFVGRETEFRAAIAFLESVRAGKWGAVLQIAGAPGVGKSRLLAEVVSVARARGFLALHGRAAEFEAELAFGVFNDALDDWLRESGPDRLRALAQGLEAELASVLPAFDSLASRRGPEISEERYRAYRAVRRLLMALAADRPLVLTLDDAHWADPGSVELMSYLAAHPPGGSVLLVVAFRAAQLPIRLARALTAAVREEQATRVDLGPLSRSAVAELVGLGRPTAWSDELYRECGGNPFFVLQLAREPSARRLVSAATLAEVGVPEAVKAALATELSSLDSAPRRLLDGAAVAGDPFELRLAAVAAEMGESSALDALGPLLTFQLLVPGRGAGEFAWRHPIVRAAVWEMSAVGWRSRAHARVAALLRSEGASASTQAPHVERSASKGDHTAVEVLVAAAQATFPRAPAIAARWYEAALKMMSGEGVADADRARLLIARAAALGGAGRLDKARSVLLDLLRGLPPRDPARVPMVTFCAGVEHLLGHHRDANRRLGECLASIDDQTSAEAVSVMIELAAGAGYENRYQEMMCWAQRALEGGNSLGRRTLVAAARGQVALASYFLGLPTDQVTDYAAGAMDALDDAELASRLDLGLWVGWTEAVVERNDRAVEHCQRVIDVSLATGQGAGLLVTQTAQAWSLLRQGALSAADEVLSRAIEAGSLAPHLFLSVAVGLDAVVATYQGDHQRALRLGEESVRLAKTADPGLIQGMSGLYCAIPLLEAGQARRARDTLLATNGGGPSLQTSRSGEAAAYEVLTMTALELGDTQEAEEWACRAEASTRGGGLPCEAAFAARATAAVALAAGDTAGAASLMLEAAARTEDSGAGVEAGRCRILAGQALGRSGQRADAIDQLTRAVVAFAGAGALGYQAVAERELRRLGWRGARMASRAPVATTGAWGGELSGREREMVRLVRRGATNREIAAAMYLSEKSVERYLSRLYARTGVRTRTALVAALAEQTGKA